MSGVRAIGRRRALTLLAGATATGVVAACGGSSAPSPPVPTHSPNPNAAPDWMGLRRALRGSLHRPGSSAYDRTRVLFNPRFDHVLPQGVAEVASSTDVAECIAFAERYRIPLALRSGGHSYLGASIGTGLVIDLRPIAGVTVDPSAHTATVGGGAALVDVYAQLAAKGVSVPAGSCPTVGLSGLTLGGGVGVVTREYGLTCDRLVEAQIVTADGQILTCNASSHPDLFWALRGGGGSFGVVTSLTLRTHPTRELTHAYLTWPWSAAASVLASWQRWATTAPTSLWSGSRFLATDSATGPTVAVVAVMVDTSTALNSALDSLVATIPTPAGSRFVGSADYDETMMLEAGCAQLSTTACHVAAETPGGTLPRDAFVAGSDFFTDLIPDAAISALISAVETRQTDPRLAAGGAAFDVLGGKVDALASDATAWAHRGALFNAQYTASWGDHASNRPLARNQHSLATIHNTVKQYANGQAYANYADSTLSNPQAAYWGTNLARLTDIRRTYDPNGVFTQPQGVPL